MFIRRKRKIITVDRDYIEFPDDRKVSLKCYTEEPGDTKCSRRIEKSRSDGTDFHSEESTSNGEVGRAVQAGGGVRAHVRKPKKSDFPI